MRKRKRCQKKRKRRRLEGTNWSLEGTGRSRARRQLAFQASDFLITKEIHIYGNCQVLQKLDSN